jgi:O-antigen/teichoic acid export membrane protein
MPADRSPELGVAEKPRQGDRRLAAVRIGGGRAMAGRLSWGLADQAVSSMTNFAVGIYVARSLGVTAFGIFSLAWVTYSLVLNVSRGLATDPFMVRFSGVATESWRPAVARSSGTALTVGIVMGAVSVLAGIVVGGPVGAAFVALGAVLPALLLQDSWRYAFFAAGQGRKSFINDAVWAVALIPAMIFAAQRGSVVGFVLAWGLAGAVAAGYGCIQLSMLPRLDAAWGWLRQQRDLGPRYLVENVSYSGSAQLRMYGVGAIAGLADVGTIRGADLLLGPYVAVMMGLSLVAVAEAARVLRRSPHRLRLFCALLGGGQAAGILAWGLGLLLLLPDGVGQFFLGSVWHPASALILPTTLAMAGVSISNGAAAGLRALGAARRSMRSQLITAGIYVSGGIWGAAVAGALGSAWGVAAATLLGSAVWWVQLHAGLREPLSPRPSLPGAKSNMRK